VKVQPVEVSSTWYADRRLATAFVCFETSLVTLSQDSVSVRSGVSAMENGVKLGWFEGVWMRVDSC
jgi:hypothetical protein